MHIMKFHPTKEFQLLKSQKYVVLRSLKDLTIGD
jgi:hypothetical protein